MITITKTQSFAPSMVGMIHYSSYWQSYSLILNVDGFFVTELDSFADRNEGHKHNAIRHHLTPISPGDKLYTVAEFHGLIQEGRVYAIHPDGHRH